MKSQEWKQRSNEKILDMREEPDFIDSVLSEFANGTRIGAHIAPTSYVKEKLSQHPELEAIPASYLNMMGDEIPEDPITADLYNKIKEEYAVGVRKSLQEALQSSVVDSIQIDEILKSKAKELIKKFSTESVAQAILQVDYLPRTIMEGFVNPEGAVLQGIIFGFKPCCIGYFIATRYEGKPEHPFERKVNAGHILCEKHAREFLAKSGIKLQE